jgi:hypothetical protein
MTNENDQLGEIIAKSNTSESMLGGLGWKLGCLANTKHPSAVSSMQCYVTAIEKKSISQLAPWICHGLHPLTSITFIVHI